jgi:hypothetical protein
MLNISFGLSTADSPMSYHDVFAHGQNWILAAIIERHDLYHESTKREKLDQFLLSNEKKRMGIKSTQIKKRKEHKVSRIGTVHLEIGVEVRPTGIWNLSRVAIVVVVDLRTTKE